MNQRWTRTIIFLSLACAPTLMFETKKPDSDPVRSCQPRKHHAHEAATPFPLSPDLGCVTITPNPHSQPWLWVEPLAILLAIVSFHVAAVDVKYGPTVAVLDFGKQYGNPSGVLFQQ
jgi:hypothetical protein